MSDISRELRKVADERLIGVANTRVSDLADRIDAEMVEWPLGADKKPIKPSQTVYKAINGDDGEYVVHSLRCSVPGWVALIKRVGADSSCIVRPDVLTHERPDSFERIADELEEWSEDNRVNGDSEVFDRAAEFSERIRRLAKERGHEHE